MANNVTFHINLKVDGKDVVKQVTMNVDELREAISSAKTATEQASAALINMNQSVEKFRNMAEGVSQLSKTLNDLTEESRSFSGAMAAANTMAGKSGDDFARLKDQVSDLAKTIPMTRDALANGLYQVISNGVPEDNWITYLDQSARASVGGIADLEEVVKVTSTVIKNYGLAWQDAGTIQDKIQLTAKNGVTSFEQMAQALPRVTANAATLGVTVDELMASFATLTGVSGNTAEVSTQLAAIFTALIKPSSEATEMAQQMGIQFDAAAIKAAGGMQQFLQSLQQQVSQFAASSGMLEQEIYGKLFGSAESLRALTPLTGNLADKFQENVNAMKDSTDTINDAFDIMGQTGSARLQMLKNAFAGISDALSSVVGGMLPVLNYTSQVGMTVVSIVALRNAFSGLAIGTKLASAAQMAFGPILEVCRATMTGTTVSAYTLQMAIRSLMITTGVDVAVVALTEALNYFCSSADSASQKADQMANAEARAADKVKQAYDSTLKQTYGNLMAKYEQLKRTWVSLRTEHEKTQWIRQNKSAFDELRIKINDISDAENAFQKNTQQVVKAFEDRAKAAAYAAELTELYKEQLELKTRKQRVDKARNTATQKYNQSNQRQNTDNPYATQNATRAGNLAGIAADMKAGGKGDITKLDNQLKSVNERIASVNAVIKQLGGVDSPIDVTGTTTPTTSTTRHTGTASTAKAPALKGSIDWYEEQMQSLRQKIEASANEGNAAAMQKEYESMTEQLKALKIRIGIEKPDEVKEDVEKALDDITITPEVRPEGITRGSAWDKRESYNNADSRMSQIRQDYEIGLIGADEAESQIAALNKQLKELGLKPIEIHLETDDAVDKMKQMGSVSVTSFESVRDTLENMKALPKDFAGGMATGATAALMLGQSMQQLGQDSEAAKAGMVIAAVGQIALSFAQALSTCKTWVEWLAFGISGTAQMISLVSTVEGFATGGVVGGTSYTGDKIPVRVNSGEMILTQQQQARLFAIANGAALYGAALGVSSEQTGVKASDIKTQLQRLQGLALEQASDKQESTMEVRGRKLYKVLRNERRATGKTL